MRGAFSDQAGMFSYISPDARVPEEHPLRTIRVIVRDVLKTMSPSLSRLYARDGRPGIAPEQLFSTLLLQALYGVRSERLMMEQLDYNLLFRWFVGLAPDDKVWHATVFSKNRDRFLGGDVFAKFLNKLLAHPQVKPLLSDEHFSVDGTLIEAWASHKSFKPKDGDGGDNFHGQRRTNETHVAPHEPQAKEHQSAPSAERQH
jgi:transposase